MAYNNEDMDEGYDEMEEEESTLPPLEELVAHPNIAQLLDDEDLQEIGKKVVDGYNDDEMSRQQWLIKYKEGMEIALQVPKDRTWPWPKASNVKFPLMTIACLQFHARAYPSLIPTDGVVSVKTVGKDPSGIKAQMADRVQTHMNYQVMEQMEDWDEEMDRLLITLPITGTEFKKTYYDSELKRNVSEHVFAKDLVINYYAKDLESAVRKTHILEMDHNLLEEKERAGLFLECDYLGTAVARDDETTRLIKDSKGLQEPKDDEDTPRTILECHCFYDLDCDGYEEPYIITVDKETQQVLRIVARFTKESIHKNGDEIVKITPDEYFTRYLFIPSPDGGFYGLGFIHIVGSLNKAVDTIINQLIDAGTLSNLQSGFLSRSFRQRSGNMQFQPGEWKVVNATGQDLGQGIYPLPVREPSAVLFSLLGMLIEVGQRVTNTTDMMVGENPGQNQKATTTQAVMESGMKVFTAVYKRVRRALSKEFLKLYKLNGRFFDKKEYADLLGIPDTAPTAEQDYDNDYKVGNLIRIMPSADPNASTSVQKMQKAQMLLQLIPLGLDKTVVLKRILQAAEIDNIDEFKLDQQQQQAGPPPDPKIMLEAQKLQLDAQKQQHDIGIEDREQLRKETETDLKARKIGVDAHVRMTDSANRTAASVVATANKTQQAAAGGPSGSTK